MAQRGKPLGNKRQHEQAKARKKREKEARRAARKSGAGLDPEQSLVEGEECAEQPVEGEAAADATSEDTSNQAGSEPDEEKEIQP